MGTHTIVSLHVWVKEGIIPLLYLYMCVSVSMLAFWDYLPKAGSRPAMLTLAPIVGMAGLATLRGIKIINSPVNNYPRPLPGVQTKDLRNLIQLESQGEWRRGWGVRGKQGARPGNVTFPQMKWSRENFLKRNCWAKLFVSCSSKLHSSVSLLITSHKLLLKLWSYELLWSYYEVISKNIFQWFQIKRPLALKSNLA